MRKLSDSRSPVSALALALALCGCTGEVSTSDAPGPLPQAPGGTANPTPGAPTPQPTAGSTAPGAPGTSPTGGATAPPPAGTAPGTPGAPGAPASACTSPGTNTGAGVLRRLSNLEYQLTLQDLFALAEPPSVEGMPPDTDKDGFRTFAEVQTVSPQHVRAYLDKAHELADALMTDTARQQKVLGCAPTATDCLAQFTASFGRVAWRRALAPDEVTALTSRATADALDESDQFKFVIEALLASPNFLFRVEVGSEPEGVSTLAPEELASRLSFALWGRSPSAGLLDQAAAGELTTPEGYTKVVSTMLADPRTQSFFGAFFRQWLGFDKLRAPNVRPTGWTDTLMPLMQEETDAAVSEVAWSNRNVFELLTSNTTRVSAEVAEFFGLPTPAADGTVTFPAGHPRENSGVLTHPALISMKTDGDPIAIRGNWLRKTFLCQHVTVPADLAALIGDRLKGLGPEQIVQARNSETACKGCHALIDPVGVGFAKFDVTGRYDGTVDIAAYGVAPGLPDAAMPAFSSVAELSLKLRELPAVSACLASKAFLYVNGHEPAAEDACTIDAASKAFAAGGQSFTGLLKGLVEAPEFRLRKAPVAQ
jgi:Protein of unknown function (DUF1592)/Protein of unknown function (DUF1587)/Protein of unknown function (DUF1588)/Protein of unknown function (DUF1595)/Protein of unknown function (DUF1585)